MSCVILPFPKYVSMIFGHPWTASLGNVPNIPRLCKDVERREACTATKFPPTPKIADNCKYF